MRHYIAIGAKPHTPVVLQCLTQLPSWNVEGPISLMIGTHVFDRILDRGTPLWKWTPADSYKKALYLFKVTPSPGCCGTWMCARGRARINNWARFRAAQDMRKLAPMWYSFDNIMTNGLHACFSCDAPAWKSGIRLYQTTALGPWRTTPECAYGVEYVANRWKLARASDRLEGRKFTAPRDLRYWLHDGEPGRF